MTRCFKSICIAAVFSLGLLSYASAQSIAGTYVLQKDSDGTVPKKQAKVTMTFKGAITGTVSMSAVQPGETVTDTGTFKVMGNLITINFKEMEWEANRQPFTLQGCTLTLPFLALGGSKGPGTSTWVKQGCNAGGGSGGGAAASSNMNINGSRNGGKGGGSGGAGGTSQSASNNKQDDNSSDPLSQSDQDFERNNPNRKEVTPNRAKSASCAQCTYVPCIKQLIRHKEEMIKVYDRLAKEFGKFYFEGSVAHPVETIDGAKSSTEDFAYLLKVHASFTTREDEFFSDVEVARYCGFENSSGLEASTHAFNCEMNFDALSRLEAAVPCHEIYDYAVEHEQEHYAKCHARSKAGTNRAARLLTPYGKANEEIANYKMEIRKLNDLLRRAEEKCRYTCRCTGEKFATSIECQANCKIGLFCAFSAANSCMVPDKPRKSPN